MAKIFGKIGSFILAIVLAVISFFGYTPKAETIPEFDGNIKNVIYMIGDGMGFNSINKTVKEEGLDFCNMSTFALAGKSKTRSANNLVTDSAAGGTALACGVRVKNYSVAVYPSDKNNEKSHPMSLTELAVEKGKAAGIITTDSTGGATPSAFSAHTSDRKNEEDITSQQMKSALTLIWGTATDSFNEETAKENGFEVIYNLEQMEALTEGTRSFAQFTDDVWHNYETEGMPSLSEMLTKAIDLVDDDEDGFFLMVEGAHIDKNNHKKNGEGMKDALLSFDNAVGIALDYAKLHKDTLVVVTADHETGGIKNFFNHYIYTSGSHTGASVPLLVHGVDNFITDGEKIDNSSIAIRTARAMGFEDFPREVEVTKEVSA